MQNEDPDCIAFPVKVSRGFHKSGGAGSSIKTLIPNYLPRILLYD